MIAEFICARRMPIPADLGPDLVHNLPAAEAREIWTEIGGYRHSPCADKLRDHLAMLSELDQVLLVFNHPLWDEKRIGQTEHRAVVLEFMRKFGTYLHAWV